jgi:hypothetical protein
LVCRNAWTVAVSVDSESKKTASEMMLPGVK